MTDGETLVVNQFRPAWAVQAYLRFAGISHHIENWSFPYTSTTGDLPQLRQGSRLVPAADILDYLQEHHKDLDVVLTPQQRAQAFAFKKMLQHELQPALQYFRWADDEHYNSITRPLYVQAIPGPFTRPWLWYNRRKQRSKAKTWATAKERGGSEDGDSTEAVMARVRKCYHALNSQLSNSDWLLSTKLPCSVDAMLFAHIADAATEPLGGVISEFPQLQAFYEAVYSAYFTAVPPSLKVSLGLGTFGQNVFLDAGKCKLGTSLRRSVPVPSAHLRNMVYETSKPSRRPLTEEEAQFEQDSKRSIMYSLAAVGFYVLWSNIASLDLMLVDDDEEE